MLLPQSQLDRQLHGQLHGTLLMHFKIHSCIVRQSIKVTGKDCRLPRVVHVARTDIALICKSSGQVLTAGIRSAGVSLIYILIVSVLFTLSFSVSVNLHHVNQQGWGEEWGIQETLCLILCPPPTP